MGSDTTNEVRLLWTGGWDSTFRLLQLSQADGLTVRPLYIRDHARKGMACELAAMRDILPGVRALARARILDFGMLDTSKTDAMRQSEQLGWLSLMNKTWFCHFPVRGVPCGRCGPCRDAMNEGMAWRMPPSSRLRYHLQRAIEVLPRPSS